MIEYPSFSKIQYQPCDYSDFSITGRRPNDGKWECTGKTFPRESPERCIVDERPETSRPNSPGPERSLPTSPGPEHRRPNSPGPERSRPNSPGPERFCPMQKRGRRREADVRELLISTEMSSQEQKRRSRTQRSEGPLP